MDIPLLRARFLSSLPIVLAVFFAGALVVFADTASTSVTVGNAAPTLTVSFNGGNAITLTENTFVWASSTVTVSDSNGCSEITSVTAQLAFASSTGEATGVTCAPQANTCYLPVGGCVATTTGNTCTGGADTSVEYDCGFAIWYPARPSDASSPGLSSALWYVTATTTDGTATVAATNTAQTVDINALVAQNVTASIGYGSLSANSNTGATNQTVTHTNTGNTAIDNTFAGTDLSDGGTNYIPTENQKYDTSDVTYASLSFTLPATTSPAATVQLALATSTATTSSVTTNVFWGIAIPTGQAAAAYTGTNTFTAILDQ